MKHKTCIQFLVLAAVLTGCLKVQKKDSVIAKAAAPKEKTPLMQPQATVITRELRLDDVFIEQVGLKQPNIYDLVLSWPQTKDRLRLSANNQVLTVLDTKTTQQWNMANLQGGTKFDLLIEILDNESHIISAETRTVEIPKDYVFPKFLRLSNHMKIQSHRVFMSDSVVLTENFNLEIQAQQLIVLNKSSIQNYLSEAKANVGSAGRSGGSVYIEVEKAEGDLDITMNSEAGGNGLKGFETPQCPINAPMGCMLMQYHCAQGGHGFPAGNNGNLTVKVKDIKDFKLYTQEQLSLGGVKGPSMHESTPEGYPVITKIFGQKDTCVRKGVNPNGADAVPGKICLLMSGSIPQPGCE